MTQYPSYFKYWGKADREDPSKYHLLPYHCLDVAAVGTAWLENDNSLMNHLKTSLMISCDDSTFIKIICFFFALHDFGKFDIRFQSKVNEARNLLWCDLDIDELYLSKNDITNFDHGNAGYSMFIKEYQQLLELPDEDYTLLDDWGSWIKAVTGHHGILPASTNWKNANAGSSVIEHDLHSRASWFSDLCKFFLSEDIKNKYIHELHYQGMFFLAGFCSISDWIASNENFVKWKNDSQKIDVYYYEAREHCYRTEILAKIGVIGKKTNNYSGIKSLVEHNNPRQVQTLIDNFTPDEGLTIIEGTTGSGKTEAALALAWKLIAARKANSIVFALPTQATSDAMLDRIYKLVPIIFQDGNANLVLAHGKRDFNKTFASLKAASQSVMLKAGNEGLIQCAAWISSSRKRVFLGQIGVCTIDQVLLSVLPVRHNFVRSFGLMKSILIVDEIHAYDSYMYGLLDEVLKAQRASGGSAILLSATLPARQKKTLFDAWHIGTHVDIPHYYPLISRVKQDGITSFYKLENNNQPEKFTVKIDLHSTKDLNLDSVMVNRLIKAAESGATVAVICNLVQSAQKLAKQILDSSNLVQVDIFHARYRFKDRRQKEARVKEIYGKDRSNTGKILVATQVVEQSLDLDFDWLVTQLCPVDLLFQRMGRLHRHNRLRPDGYNIPLCSVVINSSDDFGVHELIYGDTRILWRTREMLNYCGKQIHFPDAYRDWIEKVYNDAEWENGEEPDRILECSMAFRQMQRQLWSDAKLRVNAAMNPFADTDSNTTSLTRGSEMGYTIVPVIAENGPKRLLDGEVLEKINDYELDELLNMNSIPVPASWKWLPEYEDGYIFLPMKKSGNGWVWSNSGYTLKYTTDFGLEKMEKEK